MKAFGRLAAAALLLGCLWAPSVHAAATQHESGSVVVPLLEEGCDGYLGALLETAIREHVGHLFAVESGTRGKPFSLTPNLPASDIDISFRPAPSSPWQPFKSRVLGGESGTVPSNATEALVCLYAGTPTMFVYDAGG
jgi:hypothetical protein